MEGLKKIKDQYEKAEVSPEKALELIFGLYLVSEDALKAQGYTLTKEDYGLWRLTKPSKYENDYVFESDYVACCERFKKIRDK